jgi:hypothetical protein
MDHELICNWLGLAKDQWPPDHYTILGLPIGEADPERIEQQAHDRLLCLRGYQLSHAGLATEAMNRIAQAVVCLTDREARRAYNAQHFPHLPAAEEATPLPASAARVAANAQKVALPALGRASTASTPAPPPPADSAASVDTAVLSPNPQTQVDWRTATPPPVRVPPLLLEGPPALPPVRGNGHAAPEPPPPTAEQPAPAAAPVPTGRPADPVFDAARTSPEARRGLYTRRALYERVVVTRSLLRAWERAARYLNRPKRKLTRPAEEAELARLVGRIDEALRDFPPLLGEPGQPGYRVICLAHDDRPAAMFNGLDPEQREALARDWVAGQALLNAHRQFLRKELRLLRCQGWCARLVRASRAALNDHPGWVSAAVLLVIAAALSVLLLR